MSNQTTLGSKSNTFTFTECDSFNVFNTIYDLMSVLSQDLAGSIVNILHHNRVRNKTIFEWLYNSAVALVPFRKLNIHLIPEEFTWETHVFHQTRMKRHQSVSLVLSQQDKLP